MHIPRMLQIASWIREKDVPLFSRFFAAHPRFVLRDARVEPVDVSEAAGLVITGGPDVAEQFHNEPVSDPSLIEEPQPERDAWELAAIRTALERGIPIFGVCKGVQLMNIALGGTLHLHITGHDLPEQEDGNIQPLRYDTHASIRFDAVNSSHHQALNRLGDGLEVEAWHADDGIVEQVRLRNYPYAVGVQYHPERDLIYAPLFEEFIERVMNGPAAKTTRTAP